MVKRKDNLVTSCAGTIEKELCFQILKYRPKN